MPTNDERREVAARLREQKVWNIFTNFENCIGELCDAVFEDEGDLNDMFRLQAALAELIEPEPERTCKCESYFNGYNLTHVCTGCGYLSEHQWSFCPNCGAKVVVE